MHKEEIVPGNYCKTRIGFIPEKQPRFEVVSNIRSKEEMDYLANMSRIS